jgi:NhaP-type Na+/H+ or K+/H+ antiporter
MTIAMATEGALVATTAGAVGLFLYGVLMGCLLGFLIGWLFAAERKR